MDLAIRQRMNVIGRIAQAFDFIPDSDYSSFVWGTNFSAVSGSLRLVGTSTLQVTETNKAWMLATGMMPRRYRFKISPGLRAQTPFYFDNTQGFDTIQVSRQVTLIFLTTIQATT